MWIMSYITGNSISPPRAVKGEINRSDSTETAVISSGEHRGLRLCAPYGVFSVPPKGESAVVLPLADGEVALGVLSEQAQELEEGELMLFSRGGASVVLKNSGKVLINGREL